MRAKAILVTLVVLILSGCGGERPKPAPGKPAASSPSPTSNGTKSASMKEEKFPDLVETDLTPGGIELLMDIPVGAEVKSGLTYAEIVLGRSYQVFVQAQPKDIAEERERAKKLANKEFRVVKEEPNLLVMKVMADYDSEPSYEFMFNKKIGEKTYCVNNVIGAWQPLTEAQLAWVLKSAETLRDKPPPPEPTDLTAARKLSPELQVWHDAKGTLAFSDTVDGIAWSADGQSLYTCSGMNVLEKWTIADENRVRSEESFGISDPVSPAKGDWLATRDLAKLQIRDSKTLRVIRATELPKKIEHLAVSLSGELLAAGLEDGTIAVVDAATLATKTILGPEGKSNWALAFSPDGKRVAAHTYEDPMLRVWDIEAKKPIAQFGSAENELRSTRVYFFPDGKRIVTSDGDGVVICDLETSSIVSHGKFDSWQLAVSPDGKLLATGKDDWLQLRSTEDGKMLRKVQAHFSHVDHALFSPDGKKLATSGGNLVRIWDVDALLADPQAGLLVGDEKASLNFHQGMVDGVAFSADGESVASSDSEPRMYLTKLADGSHTINDELGVGARSTIAFSKDGKRLVGTSGMGLLKVYSVEDGKQLHRRTGLFHEKMVLTADGKFGVTKHDKEVVVVDLETQDLRELMGHTENIVGVALSPDDSHIYSLSRDKTLKVWDYATGTVTISVPLELKEGYFESLALSPDGKWIAVGGVRVLRILDTADFKVVHDLSPAEGEQKLEVAALAFSPQSDLLAVANRELLQLVEVGSGKRFASLRGHTSQILAVAFSRDGTKLVSGGMDTTVKVWDVKKQEK